MSARRDGPAEPAGQALVRDGAVDAGQSDAHGVEWLVNQLCLPCGSTRGQEQFALRRLEPDLHRIGGAGNRPRQYVAASVGQPRCGSSAAAIDAENAGARVIAHGLGHTWEGSVAKLPIAT